MSDVTCNQGLGAARYYTGLPATADALVLVMLQFTGQATGTAAMDDALRDHATLAAMLASGTGNKECTAPGWSRPQITSGTTVTYDPTNNRVDCFFPAQTVLALGSSSTLQQLNKLVVCYVPNTASAPDSSILPLTAHDYFKVCDGTDFQISMPNGFYRDGG